MRGTYLGSSYYRGWWLHQGANGASAELFGVRMRARTITELKYMIDNRDRWFPDVD